MRLVDRQSEFILAFLPINYRLHKFYIRFPFANRCHMDALANRTLDFITISWYACCVSTYAINTPLA